MSNTTYRLQGRRVRNCVARIAAVDSLGLTLPAVGDHHGSPPLAMILPYIRSTDSLASSGHVVVNAVLIDDGMT
eukprot:8366422-Heterocapsa_arctica.AAC.1